MYLFCVDFSENSLLTEQLSVRSFYDLPVLDNTLLYYQLMSFSGLGISKAFIVNNKNKMDFSGFETENINFEACEKALYKIDDRETVIIFRNDGYFEEDFSQYLKSEFYNNILSISDENGCCYCVITSVYYLRQLYNRNINFKTLLNKIEKFTDVNLTFDCYTTLLTTTKKYKSFLFDILNDKLLIKPPHIAEGVFVNERVPEGDFSIIPPVYFGDVVQIESGSVIGPNTVIYNNSLISSGTVIKNSIIFDNVFVSSGCYVDGAVCCENSSIKRNSAVFSNTVIGENALIGEDMLVEADSLIKSNVKFDKVIKSPFNNQINGGFYNKFQGLSPDKASLLGSAIATVFKKKKVIISSDGVPNSLAIKLALLSGLVASGAECIDMGTTFRNQIFFGLEFCECAYSVFVSGKDGGTNIEIFDSNNAPLSKADCCNLLDFCNKKEFVYAVGSECKNIRQIHGLKKMYIHELTSVFDSDLSIVPVINCNNTIISNILTSAINKLVDKKQKKRDFIKIIINNSGSKLSIEQGNEIFNEKILKKLVHYYVGNKGLMLLQNIYYKKLFEKDVLFLLMSVLYIVEKSKKSIAALIKALPDFFTCSKTFDCALKTGELAEKIGSFDNCFFKKEFFNIPLKTGLIKIRKNNKTDSVKVVSATDNMALSEELCDLIGGIIASTDA